ncbi:hypothetical protein F5I97DRAFT_1324339 [Phlebopus sp. FC_14]|nr:hypothetical protein F5I97DRAFT_1324339 [Phlebopus sp. FC_14]
MQLWGCRESAGIARGAVKEFNENVLDVLSEPDVEAQVRIDELVAMYKLVTVKQRSIGSLVADFDIFSRMVIRNVNELTAIMDYEERMSSANVGNTGRGESRRRRSVRRHGPEVPLHASSRQPSTGLSTQVAFGTLTLTDPTAYLLKAEQRAEETFASLYRRLVRSWSGQPGVSPTMAARRPKPELKRSQLAMLRTQVDDVSHDLRSFCNELVIFEDIFKELQREHDILIIYIKDGI